MKYIDWSEEKNEILKKDRNFSFEDVITAIQNGGILDILKHPNQDKYPNQFILYVQINNYVYTVPYVEDKNKYFLKTIYPDRVATKLFLGGKNV